MCIYTYTYIYIYIKEQKTRAPCKAPHSAIGRLAKRPTALPVSVFYMKTYFL